MRMDAKPVKSGTMPSVETAGLPAMVLSDQLVSLRRFQAQDAPALHAAACESLGELCAGMTWCHPGYSLEESRLFVEKASAQWDKREHFSFAICDGDEGEFLGSIGLSHLNAAHRFANVGYWVRTARAGRGVATAATRLMARWAFTELELNRLELVVAVNNKPSQRVAEKAGAKREGILRQRLVLGGQRLDAFVYSLVPQDLGAKI